jgi:hypothetical protein
MTDFASANPNSDWIPWTPAMFPQRSWTYLLPGLKASRIHPINRISRTLHLPEKRIRAVVCLPGNPFCPASIQIADRS